MQTGLCCVVVAWWLLCVNFGSSLCWGDGYMWQSQDRGGQMCQYVLVVCVVRVIDDQYVVNVSEIFYDIFFFLTGMVCEVVLCVVRNILTDFNTIHPTLMFTL